MTRDELIIMICREAGDVGSDDDLIGGYTSNYDEDYLEDVVDPASDGDVRALARMRADAGLPIFR